MCGSPFSNFGCCSESLLISNIREADREAVPTNVSEIEAWFQILYSLLSSQKIEQRSGDIIIQISEACVTRTDEVKVPAYQTVVSDFEGQLNC